MVLPQAGPVLAYSVSVNTHELCLADSVVYVLMVSSIPSHSYNLSFLSSMGSQSSQSRNQIEPSNLVSLQSVFDSGSLHLLQSVLEEAFLMTNGQSITL